MASPRALEGPTGHVVIVGAGFAGLAAALHLAGRGREVTVLERDHHPGGRCGRRDVDGYRLDTGATVLTMPDIAEEAVAATGGRLSDHVQLERLDPAYRASFADGSALNVHSDGELMAAEVEAFAGSRQAAGYRQLRAWLRKLYRVEFDRFIAANFDTPLDMLGTRLAQLAAMGGFRRLDSAIGRFIDDERLKRVFSFQSLYAGQSPHKALALYAIIAYMDTVAGVYFPRGGMRALPDGLAAAAERAGVRFVYDAEVTGLERANSRVTAVTTTEDRYRCDAMVLTTELPTSYRLLGCSPRRPVALRPAPSAMVMQLGVPSPAAQLPHHSISFGAAWRSTFDEIIDNGRLMTDPSLLVTRPTVTDPQLAPEGRDLLYVLAPVPNTRVGDIRWPELARPYAEELTRVLETRLLPGLSTDSLRLDTVTPHDWQRRDMVAGTPFSWSHTFAQTGPFRPRNLPRGVDNAVLAGSGTVPGVGIPTSLLSGRLAADRITGTREPV